jgi:hypothetical protein
MVIAESLPIVVESDPLYYNHVALRVYIRDTYRWSVAEIPYLTYIYTT